MLWCKPKVWLAIEFNIRAFCEKVLGSYSETYFQTKPGLEGKLFQANPYLYLNICSQKLGYINICSQKLGYINIYINI